MFKYSDEDFLENLQRIEACSSIVDLEKVLNKFFGLQAYVVQFMRTCEDGGRRNYVAITNGMPQVLIDYLDEHYGNHMGPVGKSILNSGQPVWFSKVLDDPHFVETKYKRTLQALFELTGDGVFVPTYFKSHWGAAFVTFGKPQNECSDVLIRQVETLFHQIHIRYRCLKDEFRTSVTLTKREVDVIELLSIGKTNNEIAQILDIKQTTVSSYVQTIYLKLGVDNRVTATLRAIYLGIAN